MSASIRPDESVLTGEWIAVGGKLEADEVCERIEHLTKHELVEVAVSRESGGWDTLYRDPRDGRLWEKTYPFSHMHGGGPPRLAVVSNEDARRRYDLPNE